LFFYFKTFRDNMKKLMRRIVCAAAFSVGIATQAFALMADSASLYLQADPGNYIGYNLPLEGKTFVHGIDTNVRNYRSGPLTSTFYSGNGALLPSSNPPDFSLTFMPAKYSVQDNEVKFRPLEIGFYDNARRAFFGAELNPGLDVSGFSRGDNRLSGWFNVLEVSYLESGDIYALAVDFGQYSNTFTQAGPGLYGSFRFNSDIPLTMPVPEPATWALHLLGFIAIAGAVARLHRRNSN
jgi:hypothetical protein